MTCQASLCIERMFPWRVQLDVPCVGVGDKYNLHCLLRHDHIHQVTVTIVSNKSPVGHGRVHRVSRITFNYVIISLASTDCGRLSVDMSTDSRPD